MSENWYAENAVRAYPIDDLATNRDDAGNVIPYGIVVDCRVMLPYALAPEVWISGISVTDKLVAVVLVQNKDNPQAIATLTLPQPLTPFRTYWMKPLVAGVNAAIAFSDQAIRYVGRCTNYSQSRLLANCLIRYRPADVSSIKKSGIATALTGSVRLEGSGTLMTQAANLLIDNTLKPAIIFKLANDIDKVAAMRDFAGPCAKRPDSNTCDRAPVETIGGVIPDCEGSIGLEVRGAELELLDANDTVAAALYHPTGLTTLCGEINTTVKGEDVCNPEPPIDFSFPEISSVSIGSEASAECTDLPHSAAFNVDNPEFWEVISGNYGSNGSGYYSTGVHPNYPIGAAVLHSCENQPLINRVLRMAYTVVNPPMFTGQFYQKCFTGFIIGWRPYGEFYAIGSVALIINGKRGQPIAPLYDIEVRKFLHLPPTATEDSRCALSGAVIATTFTESDLHARQRNDLLGNPPTAEEALALADASQTIQLMVAMSQDTSAGPGSLTKTRLSITQTRASGTRKTMSIDLPNLDSPIPYSKFGIIQWQAGSVTTSYTVSNS